MARKYLRGLQYTTGTNGRDIPIFMRFCYEFWGYCVNTPSTLTTPGGMPTTPTSAPAGFFEGASVLATGSDGVTSAIGINFNSVSASFNTSMIGKHITIWSATDVDSTDNSIYRIIGVPSPTQLQIIPFSGGTPDISTLKNNLTSRSALNYRVIDVVAASQLGIAAGNYWVGTLTGASTVNSGQASSQFQWILRGSANAFGNFTMLGSPAGLWGGSSFTGTTLGTLTTNEIRTLTTNTFSGTSSLVNGYITLIGDKDFFMGHIRSPNSNVTSGYYFYTIIPQRIYTQAQDLNLLTMMVGYNNLTSAVATDSHSTSFSMVGQDNVTRTCQLITRNFVSDSSSGASYTVGPNLSLFLATPSQSGAVIFSDALISHTSALGQFSFARARLRQLAFTSSSFPQFHILGNNGEFIHMGNGVLWPWDGSIMPSSILPLGT